MGAAEQMKLDLQLKGRSSKTIDTYLRNAASFVKFHDNRPPARLGEPEVRAWLAHLVNDRHFGPAGLRPFIGAVKFLYEVTLRRPEVTAHITWPKRPRRLPEILSPEQVSHILACADTPRAHVTFAIAYGTGMRLSEIAHLQVADIRSDRGVIVVRSGKGAKDRLVPLSPKLLEELRAYWRQVRPPAPWLFPGATPDKPITIGVLQDAFRKAAAAAGWAPGVFSFHSLRHAFATHQLEANVDLATIQAVLGHANISTTTLYTHVRNDRVIAAGSPLDRLA